MCGIAGTLGYTKPDLCAILKRIRHRGPDFLGVHTIPGTDCHLGHVRLSILDLDARSHQPFMSPCGRYVLIFNGEIYNFQSLRDALKKNGEFFHTTSDTEVLLKWLIRHGVEGLPQIDGMFAFCFADTIKKTLLLARDPIGEKPLYYSFHKYNGRNHFAFASEIKGLLTLKGIDTSIDRNGLLDYLRFLYTAPPRTLHGGIRELAPGHYLIVPLTDTSEQTARSFYDLEKHIQFTENVVFSEAAQRFQSLFKDSVALRLISDVPVGLFLSAGIDSNAILVSAQGVQTRYPLQTFTLKYERGFDESHTAKRIAENLGLTNTAIPFKEMDFFPALERIVELFDQPFGNSTAIVSDMIAAEASSSCKVCLVGDGGDELLIGYPRYKALGPFTRLQGIGPCMKKILTRGSAWLPELGPLATVTRRTKQFCRALNKPIAEAFIDWSTYLDTVTLARATRTKDVKTDFYNELVATFVRHQQDPVRAAAIVDMKSFVPFNLMQSADRTSMAHSLELRSPFLSVPLIQSTLGLPSIVKMGAQTKPLVTVPFSEELPQVVLNQAKKPFNPPLRLLLRRNLKPLENYLVGSTVRLNNLLEPSFVRTEVDDFIKQRRDNSTFLWGLATLEHWLRRQS